jgi:hypothetical protein
VEGAAIRGIQCCYLGEDIFSGDFSGDDVFFGEYLLRQLLGYPLEKGGGDRSRQQPEFPWEREEEVLTRDGMFLDHIQGTRVASWTGGWEF